MEVSLFFAYSQISEFRPVTGLHPSKLTNISHVYGDRISQASAKIGLVSFGSSEVSDFRPFAASASPKNPFTFFSSS